MSNIIFKDRRDVQEHDFEFHFNWESPWTGMEREKRKKIEPIFRQIEQNQQSSSEN